ncbi:MAG: hypothetical protein HUJ58_01880 [Erysipelotrichaceae bacterium]|nr:hypothetical protein [Erysipelotrichaceae bacterium]
MKKFLSVLLLAAILLTGCGKKETTPEITDYLTVLAPKGAPSMSLLGYYATAKDQNVITTMDGADALTAALTAPNSEYDIVIAPVNLGATLISKGATEYRLAGVVTWGNLYLVSSDETVTIDTVTDMIAFGQNAVPNKVLNTVFEGKEVNIEWFNATSDVAAALLSGQYTTGVVAEPVCTNVLAKSEGTFKLVGDFQQAWKDVTGLENYPQAAVFVKPAAYAEKKEAYEAIFANMAAYAPKDIDTLKADMDAVGQEALGVPSASMTMDTFNRMNVKFTPAADCKEAIERFLQTFGLSDFTNLYNE